MATFDLTFLALGTAAVLALGFAFSMGYARIASPVTVRRIAMMALAGIFFVAPPAAAIAATGLLTIGLMGMPVMPSVDLTSAAPSPSVIFVTKLVEPNERYVELENGKGVVVFKTVNGKMASRLKLYRTTA